MACAYCKSGWGKDSKLLEGKPGRRRKKGRPRLKRTDDAEVDLNMDVIRWRKTVLDRKEWASVETEAKVELEGLL
jgi:transposase